MGDAAEALGWLWESFEIDQDLGRPELRGGNLPQLAAYGRTLTYGLPH